MEIDLLVWLGMWQERTPKLQGKCWCSTVAKSKITVLLRTDFLTEFKGCCRYQGCGRSKSKSKEGCCREGCCRKSCCEGTSCQNKFHTSRRIDDLYLIWGNFKGGCKGKDWALRRSARSRTGGGVGCGRQPGGRWSSGYLTDLRI